MHSGSGAKMKESLQSHLRNLISVSSGSPVAPHHLSCQILVNQLGVEMSVNFKQTNLPQANRVLKVWLLKNWGLLENHQVLCSVVRLLRVPDQESNTEKVANRL